MKKLMRRKKVKHKSPWTYVKEDLRDEKITGRFYEQELQKQNKSRFLNENVTIIYLKVGFMSLICKKLRV